MSIFCLKTQKTIEHHNQKLKLKREETERRREREKERESRQKMMREREKTEHTMIRNGHKMRETVKMTKKVGKERQRGRKSERDICLNTSLHMRHLSLSLSLSLFFLSLLIVHGEKDSVFLRRRRGLIQ